MNQHDIYKLATPNGIKISPFVIKILSMMADDMNYTDKEKIKDNGEHTECLCGKLIEWSPDGECIEIRQLPVFEKRLLVLYFKHANYCSFIRQLNSHGFNKIQTKNKEILIYKHTDFSEHNKHCWYRVQRENSKFYKQLYGNAPVNKKEKHNPKNQNIKIEDIALIDKKDDPPQSNLNSVITSSNSDIGNETCIIEEDEDTIELDKNEIDKLISKVSENSLYSANVDSINKVFDDKINNLNYIMANITSLNEEVNKAKADTEELNKEGLILRDSVKTTQNLLERVLVYLINCIQNQIVDDGSCLESLKKDLDIHNIKTTLMHSSIVYDTKTSKCDSDRDSDATDLSSTLSSTLTKIINEDYERKPKSSSSSEINESDLSSTYGSSKFSIQNSPNSDKFVKDTNTSVTKVIDYNINQEFKPQPDRGHSRLNGNGSLNGDNLINVECTVSNNLNPYYKPQFVSVRCPECKKYKCLCNILAKLDTKAAKRDLGVIIGHSGVCCGKLAMERLAKDYIKRDMVKKACLAVAIT